MHSGNSTGTTSRPQPAAAEQEVPGERPLFSAGTYELLALLVATIGMLGLCNNLLVLVLYYKFKRLRTPTNLFLVNISLSDLLVSVFGVSLTFTSCLRSRWVWDAAGCVWDGFSNSLFGGWRGHGRLTSPPRPAGSLLSAARAPLARFPRGSCALSPLPTCPQQSRPPAPTVASPASSDRRVPRSFVLGDSSRDQPFVALPSPPPAPPGVAGADPRPAGGGGARRAAAGRCGG